MKSYKEEVKSIIESNSNKIFYFVKWYIESDTKDKKDYNSSCKQNTVVEYETAMDDWLYRDDVQSAIKYYLKSQSNIKMLNIYNAMYKKALKGDEKCAKWVDNFFKSDFFKKDKTEIDKIIEGLEIE